MHSFRKGAEDLLEYVEEKEGVLVSGERMIDSIRTRLQQLLSRLISAQPPQGQSAVTTPTPAQAQAQAILERQWTALEHAEGEKQLSHCRSLATHLRALEPRLRSLEADMSRLKLLDSTSTSTAVTATATATVGGEAEMAGSTRKTAATAACIGGIGIGETGSARVLARDKWKELSAHFEASTARARSCIDSIEQFLRVEQFLELFGTLVTWCSAADEASERLCKPMPSTVLFSETSLLKDFSFRSI